MNKLSKEAYQEAREAIMEDGRPLEQALFRNHFEKGSVAQVISELEEFQNDDGGFGNALEPDFRLPLSSPAATALAFQKLVKLEQTDELINMAAKAINYLEQTFDEEKEGWYNVPKQVNDYPHGAWWSYDTDLGQSALDKHWGNPTAELIGYLYKYSDHVDKLDVTHLVDHAIDYLHRMAAPPRFESEHEIYSFIRLYHMLEDDLKVRMETNLILAVDEIVSVNRNEWGQYVPKPLDIVNKPDANNFGLFKNIVEENLMFLIESLEENGRISPTWAWSGYKEKWEEAKLEWDGILTYDALVKLDNFDLI